MDRMQIDSSASRAGAAGSRSAAAAAAGAGPSSSSFMQGPSSSRQQQQLPFPASAQLTFPGGQYQDRAGRQQWPAALFSSGIGQPPGASTSSMRDAPQHSQSSFSSMPTGSTAAAAAAAGSAGEPTTPVGSPVKGSGPGGSSSRGGAAGVGGLGSPSWFSPKSRVRYSDRFIPSRAATARLDFSALDREVVADQVNRNAQDREVSQQPSKGVASACVAAAVAVTANAKAYLLRSIALSRSGVVVLASPKVLVAYMCSHIG